jgi:bacillithiol biosynthesis cysteine-adding enzyme BshC
MPFQSTSIPFRQTGKFSALFSDYTENQNRLRSFHSGFPEKEHFLTHIQERMQRFSASSRKLLHGILRRQTQAIPCHEAQETSLQKLASSKGFTVSCGHQLCIGGGPQYLLFKILSTIRLAEELESLFPELRFVPVFWMAGEDHDIEEIQQLQFFGKKYRIEVQGSGPCGRISTTGIAGQLQSIPDFPEPVISAYQTSKNLAEASRKWLNHYFGDKGLLILDADEAELKSSFLPEMLAELESPDLADKIRNQSSRLDALGYGIQLHCRDLNLFYMEDGLRVRLEKNGHSIRSTDGRFEWNLPDALAYFSVHPEKLSPNACLRPLYSQKILPEVAFIGGPAEIAYWLQLKTAFELHGIVFPLLVPRFSALLLPRSRCERLEKLGLRPEELFLDSSQLRKKIALGDESIPEPGIRDAFAGLLAFARETDSGTAASLEADLSRLEDQVQNMKRKVRKAAEKKAETQLKQVENLLDYCFPDGGLLERSESWLSVLQQNPKLISELSEAIDPLHFQFLVAELHSSSAKTSE